MAESFIHTDIFIDTPGIHKPTHKLGNLMNKKAYSNTEGIDVILFLVDIYKGFGRGDAFILEKIKNHNVPIFLLLNKEFISCCKYFL